MNSQPLTDAQAVAADAERFGKHIPVNGLPIDHRIEQMAVWGIAAGVFAAAIVAGWYFGLLEVAWHVWIGPVHFRIFDLKNWWDGTGVWAKRGGMGFIHSPSWMWYRHDYRDLGEPAAAVMGAKTLLASRRYWGVRASKARMIVTPPIVIAVAFVLITAGTWLIYFGLPSLWARLGWPAFVGWHGIWTEAGRLSVLTLALGFGIGYVLHHIWGPVGATIQGDLLDRAVDKADGRWPWWVRHSVTPPVIRERFALMRLHNSQTRTRKPIPMWIIWTLIALAVAFAALGIIGHFVVGVAGISVPYLAP